MFRFAFVIVLLASWPAHAFNYSTHAKICELAYQQASAGVRFNIDALVQKATRTHGASVKTFPQLCGWPDTVRKQSKYKHTGPWHYLNVARSATEVSAKACPKDGCVLSAIEVMFQRLHDSPTSDWEALAFLGHLVGDLHQPMHVSYADDRGGNRTKLYYQGERTNLHALWDNNIPGTFTESHDQYQTPVLPRMDMPQNTLIWANESFKQTRKIYSGYRSGMSLSENDILGDRHWVQQRIRQAAQRLASVLEGALRVNELPEVE